MSRHVNKLLPLQHHWAFWDMGVLKRPHRAIMWVKIKSAWILFKSTSDYPPWLKNSKNVLKKLKNKKLRLKVTTFSDWKRSKVSIQIQLVLASNQVASIFLEIVAKCSTAWKYSEKEILIWKYNDIGGSADYSFSKFL